MGLSQSRGPPFQSHPSRSLSLRQRKQKSVFLEDAPHKVKCSVVLIILFSYRLNLKKVSFLNPQVKIDPGPEIGLFLGPRVELGVIFLAQLLKGQQIWACMC